MTARAVLCAASLAMTAACVCKSDHTDDLGKLIGHKGFAKRFDRLDTRNWTDTSRGRFKLKKESEGRKCALSVFLESFYAYVQSPPHSVNKPD